MRVSWRTSIGTLALLSLIGSSIACSSSSGQSAEPLPTLITVAPSTFGQGVVCGSFPGAWKSYVATLTDVTDPAHPFVLASSNPVPCNMPVSFSWVVPGHRYTAEIDGYEQADLVSYGGYSSGNRLVADRATGQGVEPRWQTKCGVEDQEEGGERVAVSEPTTAFLHTNMVVRDCAPLQQVKPSSEQTGLSLQLDAIRGNLSCGEEPGQIDRLRVWPEDPALSPTVADCDASLTFSQLEADRVYRFRIEAFESNSSLLRWATSCEGRTKEGVTLPTSCDPLSNRGALQVDVKSILDAADRACSLDDVVTYRASVLGMAVESSGKSCNSNAIFYGLEPVSYQIVVDGYDSAGEERFNAFCEGVVEPASMKTVTCQVVGK